MSRLVVVSNRVADLNVSAQQGGLAVALADALRKRGGVWFGWSGENSDKAAQEEPSVEQHGNVERIAVSLSKKDYNDFYVGYANSVLWPLFHYRLDIVKYRRNFFDGYLRVNQLYAEKVLPFLKSDDVIWAQDYHLILFAKALRERGCKQRMGYFLHIPFPPPDLLAASPNHKALINGLLAYDVIGFQTSTDANNLRRYLMEFPSDAKVDDDGRITVDGREIRIDRFPIGIDNEVFADMATNSPDDVQIDMMRRRVLGRKQIIGVDRLDYSKGLPARAQAFGRLLEKFPDMEKAVTFLQIAPPTRQDVSAYSVIRKEMEALTGAINGKYSDFNWTPIRYIHRAVARDKLAALFRGSQVGFVTPLRDGMNLVAKEYVAAQDPDDPGVLVLSQFAGAAEEMNAAVIVNPYDIDEMANKLHKALTMSLDERKERHRHLLVSIRDFSAQSWLDGFLGALEVSGQGKLAEDAA